MLGVAESCRVFRGGDVYLRFDVKFTLAEEHSSYPVFMFIHISEMDFMISSLVTCGQLSSKARQVLQHTHKPKQRHSLYHPRLSRLLHLHYSPSFPKMPPKVPPYIRGQIEYFTSPYEQKLFSDIFDARLMMTKMRRKLSFVRDMAPGFIIFASVYTWGNATHERLSREDRY